MRSIFGLVLKFFRWNNEQPLASDLLINEFFRKYFPLLEYLLVVITGACCRFWCYKRYCNVLLYTLRNVRREQSSKTFNFAFFFTSQPDSLLLTLTNMKSMRFRHNSFSERRSRFHVCAQQCTAVLYVRHQSVKHVRTLWHNTAT